MAEQQTLSFLRGGGETAELIRNYDWKNNPLGSPDKWSENLRMTVSLMLHSPVPMFIYWGSDFISLYNDEFKKILSNTDKHPEMMGKPAEIFWAEAWHTIRPAMTELMKTGKAFKAENVCIPIIRNNVITDVFWTYAYNPVFNTDGSVAGILMTVNETTATVNSLKELEIQTVRFDNFVREATVGIVILMGEELVVEKANQPYADLLDRKADELIGKPLFDIVPEAADPFREMLLEVLHTGEPLLRYDVPYFVFSNGEKKEGFLDVVYQPYREKDGSITGVIAILYDVSPQLAAKKALEEAALFSDNIFYNSPVAYLVFTGNDMKIERVNGNMLSMLGRDKSILGKPFLDAMPELKETPIPDRLTKVFTTGETYTQPEEKILLLKNGELHEGYFNYIYKALKNTKGEIYGIMVTATEVTEQTLMRNASEKSDQQVRAMVQSAPFPIGVYAGRELKIILANETMLKTYGKGREVIGKLYTEILPELKNSPILKQLDDVLTTGIPFHAKNQRVDITMDGKPETFYFNYSFTPVLDEHGNVYAVMNTAADVTDLNIAKRKIEENENLLQSRIDERTGELKDANSHLTASNKELEQFSYAASHDMQEPLRKVQTFSGFLMENHSHQLDEKGKEYLQKIGTSVARMRTIIDDLLQYSHQTREDQEFIQTDINGIIQQVESDLELIIQQKQATIILSEIPQIKSVPAQINQLFYNLLSNALKFSKPGIAAVINISAALLTNEKKATFAQLNQEKNYTHITVSDNGIGFEQQYAEQIFSLFKRLHGRSEYEGTGIGLGLCKKIVLNHEGIIFAESVPDEGTSFHIILPL